MTSVLRTGVGLMAGAIMGLGLAGSVQAQPASARPQIEWLTPAARRPLPQSKAQEAHGKFQGRTLPAPELLQPTLDPGLPSYARPQDLQLSGTFKIACSDVLPDLVRRWIKGFEQIYPKVHLDLAPPFEGSLGAVALARGEVDGVFVSRELRPSDITQFRAHYGYRPFSVPVSGGTWRHFGFLDAVVVLVNPANPVHGLSFAQLDRAFSRTHLRGGTAALSWGDLGATGAWASRPVHLYGIKPWNGFEEFFRERVLSAQGRRGKWRAGITYSKTVFPVAAQVAKDRDALGYSGLAFVDAPVKLVTLQAAPGDAFVAPTYTNVARARYPLSRLVYFNVNRKPGTPLNPALQQFLLYVLSRQGQEKVLEQAIYLPLRGFQVQDSRARLATPDHSLHPFIRN